jgi:hypothetical protein
MFGGITYEGNWVNDVKHGPGRLTYADGETICGTWQNNHLNGIATRKVAEKTTTVIFKNDMLIMNNDSGLSCGDIMYGICSACLFCLFFSSFFHGWYILLIAIIPYIIWSCGYQSATQYM